jgi:hypothetical protein
MPKQPTIEEQIKKELITDERYEYVTIEAIDELARKLAKLIAQQRQEAVLDALERVALKWGETCDEAASNVLKELGYDQ